MAATGAVKTLNIITAALHQKNVLGCFVFQSYPLLSQSRYYAARKGTRERARRKKVKKEVQKIDYVQRLKMKKSKVLSFEQYRNITSKNPEKVDNIWIEEFHQPRIYTFEEAIECHRQSHHSSMYNSSDAFVHAFLELDMMGTKPTRLVNAFSKVVNIPNPFDHGEKREIIAFCSDPKMAELASEAGASLSGGQQLIKSIKTGSISLNDYDYAIAHPDIMIELSVIKGLLKRKFPSPRAGTLGINLPQLIATILNGVKYQIRPHEHQLRYGTGMILFGRLNMDIKKLEENFIAVLKNVEKYRPKRDGEFIFRTSIESYPTTELIKIDFIKYLTEGNIEIDSDEEEENIITN